MHPPLNWTLLELAFENNAKDYRSFLYLGTGHVVRVSTDPAGAPTLMRLRHASEYVEIPPVERTVQYRWLEGFIATSEDHDVQHALMAAAQGAGAFGRFKAVLAMVPLERARWYRYRRECLHEVIKSWLETNAISTLLASRIAIDAPTAEHVQSYEKDAALEALIGKLEWRDIEALLDVATFLRRSMAR